MEKVHAGVALRLTVQPRLFGLPAPTRIEPSARNT